MYDVRFGYGSASFGVADRERDIREVLDRCAKAGVSLVIRAAQERALADDGGKVRAAAAAIDVADLLTLPEKRRGSPGKAGRPKP